MYLNVAICLPRDTTTVGVVRGAVVHALRLFGADDECVADIALAVSEACGNVIEHAGGEDEYEVQVGIDEERCTISVRDTGRGFDPSLVDGTMPRPDSARGRGVAIMKAVMDSVDLTQAPKRGTVVNLVRELTFHGEGPLAPLRRRPR